MKRIICPMLIFVALLATGVKGGLVELRNRSGEVTYERVDATKYNTWKFPPDYNNNHVLFIFIKNVSMHGWISKRNSTGCIGRLYLLGIAGTCQNTEIKCLFYQPVGCILKNTASIFTGPHINGVACDKYIWFHLSKMPRSFSISEWYYGEKFVQVQYKYLECRRNETEYSTTVTDSSTDQTSSVTANDVTSDNSPQMLNGRTELIAGLAIAIGLLVMSWVVLGVVIFRNRSKAISRNPDVKVTEAEESNTREIVVNAIYGENFDRMGDDSQQTSSSAVYSRVHK
ncbi:uncharacterized protein LOC120328881 [Styela clava]